VAKSIKQFYFIFNKNQSNKLKLVLHPKINSKDSKLKIKHRLDELPVIKKQKSIFYFSIKVDSVFCIKVNYPMNPV
jgi:hypothetical protein